MGERTKKILCNEYQIECGGKESGICVKIYEDNTYNIAVSATGDSETVREKLKKAIEMAERKIDETNKKERG